MQGRLLLIDTETGGLDPYTDAILSLAALVLNYDGQVIDEMYTLIYDPHSWRNMFVQDSALKINGLTREKVAREGVTPLHAVGMLSQMLNSHDMLKKITLAGHNVAFDEAFLKQLWLDAGCIFEFGERFSHRKLCTQGAAMLLDQAGVIKPKGHGLDDLCEYFGVKLNREGGHNALNDAKATAEVLQHLMRRSREGL